MRTAHDLLAELNAYDESPRIVAKRAREIGKPVMETVIADESSPSGNYPFRIFPSPVGKK